MIQAAINASCQHHFQITVEMFTKPLVSSGSAGNVVDRCRKEKQLTPETAKNTTAQCNWSNPPVLSLACATGPIKEEPGTAELEKLEWSDEDCPRVTHRGVGGGTECLH